MLMELNSCRVCVTGAAGYIGSLLVKKLLDRGYVVHATLRNLGDESKTRVLMSLAGAQARLLLFEADIYDAAKFEPAIRGCEFVFLVATPLVHNADSSQYKDTAEAAVDAVRRILQSCEKSGSVKRVIYTGSVMAASPAKEDGTGFKDFIDESCWTPLHLSYSYCEDFEKSYQTSKTLAEKELLNYNKQEEGGLEVVSLACGLVGGDTLLPNAPGSVQVIVSPLTGEPHCYRQLQLLQTLLGSIPLVHIEDVCEAHIFCIKKLSMNGRFLCARAYPAMQEIVNCYDQNYPEMQVMKEVVGTERGVQCSDSKLANMGFEYKYDMNNILEDSVHCMKRLGYIKEQP